MAAYPRWKLLRGLSFVQYSIHYLELGGDDCGGREPSGSWVLGGLLGGQLYRHIAIYAEDFTI